MLGPFTILKEDNFPGMRSSKVPQPIEGAPNFRQMPALPVFGVGMPTIEGITAVLKVRKIQIWIQVQVHCYHRGNFEILRLFGMSGLL